MNLILNRMNVLLTSVGRRNYLIDYFKEAVSPYGGKVYAVNSHSNSPALYVADAMEIAPPIISQDYIPFLKQFCLENGIQLIVPLLDLELPVLAKEKEEFLELGIHVLVPSLDLALLSNDKFKTYQFLKENGFQTVPVFLSLDQFHSAKSAGLIDFPVVLKPRWGMGSVGVYVAENDEELTFYYKKLRKEVESSILKFESSQDFEGAILIMEKLSGEEYMLDIINDLDGNHQITVVNRKIFRKGGETEGAETIDKPELSELGLKIATLTKHPLVLDADVFVNEKGCFILEFNPRFSGGYPFSHLSGVQLPKALIRWVKREPFDPSEYLSPAFGTVSLKGISMISTNQKKTQRLDSIKGQTVL
ncbi:carbamoyl-phosphate synthase large subunit [Algoriphagus zhangzhouensis]|uniref:Carbamoyl-phosphate synthase large subunit n=2 Tax=Algoriphagus zhangzhouensis TaxID=1073327 RepID=A0A1M7ZF35_9BACT|nr:carbamoyl-phosphate synthase large subunit [Algoriphagus zhangzhouensis]SHO63452.1 carbamoyl-phosphate synthase large subunit [Algoriphagus zhangzhouensis]